MISFMVYSWLPPRRIAFRCIHVHEKRPWVRLGSFYHTMPNLRKLGKHLRNLHEPHPISRAGYISRKPTKIYVNNTIPVVFRRLYCSTFYTTIHWKKCSHCIYQYEKITTHICVHLMHFPFLYFQWMSLMWTKARYLIFSSAISL